MTLQVMAVLVPAQVMNDRQLADHRFAAQAITHLQAAFRLHQLFGHTLMNQHVEVVAVRVQHAHGTAVGAEIFADALQEALAHGLCRLRLLKEGGAVIQQCQFAVLVFQLGSLGLHALFKVGVGVLQLVGHLVEAARQHAKFVVALDRKARAKILFAHAFQSALQARDRRHDHIESPMPIES